jgi:hypothetical protein
VSVKGRPVHLPDILVREASSPPPPTNGAPESKPAASA